MKETDLETEIEIEREAETDLMIEIEIEIDLMIEIEIEIAIGIVIEIAIMIAINVKIPSRPIQKLDKFTMEKFKTSLALDALWPLKALDVKSRVWFIFPNLDERAE